MIQTQVISIECAVFLPLCHRAPNVICWRYVANNLWWKTQELTLYMSAFHFLLGILCTYTWRAGVGSTGLSAFGGVTNRRTGSYVPNSWLSTCHGHRQI